MAHDSLYWNLDFPEAIVIAALTAVPVLLTTWLATAEQRARRRWAVRVAVVTVLTLFCPCTQWVALEPIQMSQLAHLGDKARAVDLVGKKKDEVRAVLGAPSWVVHYSPDTETWEYHPVRFYPFGSTLQVHFKQDGVVKLWENYDD